MGLPTFNKPVLSDCVGLGLCAGRKSSGGLGAEESAMSEHGAGHIQKAVGHTAQGARMRMTAFAKLSIPASACRIVLDRDPRPVVQRQPKPHIGCPAHAHHAAFAAAAGHGGHAAEVAQSLVVSSAEGI
jgi:hypothetical protein